MYTTIMVPLPAARSAATLCAPLSLPKRRMEKVALEKIMKRLFTSRPSRNPVAITKFLDAAADCGRMLQLAHARSAEPMKFENQHG